MSCRLYTTPFPRPASESPRRSDRRWKPYLVRETHLNNLTLDCPTSTRRESLSNPLDSITKTSPCRSQLRTKWSRCQERTTRAPRRKWWWWPETCGRFTSPVSSQPLWVLVAFLAFVSLTKNWEVPSINLLNPSRVVWGQGCRCCLCLIKASSCWGWWGVALLLQTTSECWGRTGEPQ